MASATLVIRILADASQAARTMGQASGTTSKFGTALNKAAIPAAALVIGMGHAAKAAADDQAAQALLAAQLKRSAGATDAQVASTEDWIAKTAFATGVADDELRPALATLARATGDVSKAQDAMGLALDISAATGKDVGSVSAALAKGYAGNTTALGRLVPGLDKGVLATKDMNKITAELARTMGGSAAVKANTTAGQFERLKVGMQETEESIGAALLPAMMALGSALRTGAQWAAQHGTAMKGIVIALAALAVAILAAKAGILAYNVVTGIMAGITATSAAATEGSAVAMTVYAIRMAAARVATLAYQAVMLVVRGATLAWTAAQWLLNVALTANPIGLVIALVAALVVAIIIAYKKSQTFRNIVAAAWHGIQVAAQFVWNSVLKPIFTFIIAYYRLLWMAAQASLRLIVAAWNWLRGALAAAWGWIKANVIDRLVQAFHNAQTTARVMRDVIAGVWRSIREAIAGAWRFISGIFDRFVRGIQWVIDWISKIKIPNPVAGLLNKIGIHTAAVAPAAGPTATTRAATTVQPGRSAGGIVVNVILDGKRVGGYVDRVITSRLDHEGWTLAAGAWG